MLPIFPPFFLFIGGYLADACVKKRPKFVQSYVIFGVILECFINTYFVHYHEVGAYVPMAYIKTNYPSYQSLITNCKFEANYLSLNHRKGEQAQLLFVTHDPPFVKYVDKEIPLIHSIEHPIIEIIEFMSLIERYPESTAPGFSKSYYKGKVTPAQVPDFAIVDHIDQPYVTQALKSQFLDRFYDHEKEFYWSMERTREMRHKYRHLYKSKSF